MRNAKFKSLLGLALIAPVTFGSMGGCFFSAPSGSSGPTNQSRDSSPQQPSGEESPPKAGPVSGIPTREQILASLKFPVDVGIQAYKTEFEASQKLSIVEDVRVGLSGPPPVPTTDQYAIQAIQTVLSGGATVSFDDVTRQVVRMQQGYADTEFAFEGAGKTSRTARTKVTNRYNGATFQGDLTIDAGKWIDFTFSPPLDYQIWYNQYPGDLAQINAVNASARFAPAGAANAEYEAVMDFSRAQDETRKVEIRTVKSKDGTTGSMALSLSAGTWPALSTATDDVEVTVNNLFKLLGSVERISFQSTVTPLGDSSKTVTTAWNVDNFGTLDFAAGLGIPTTYPVYRLQGGLDGSGGPKIRIPYHVSTKTTLPGLIGEQTADLSLGGATLATLTIKGTLEFRKADGTFQSWAQSFTVSGDTGSQDTLQKTMKYDLTLENRTVGYRIHLSLAQRDMVSDFVGDLGEIVATADGRKLGTVRVDAKNPARNGCFSTPLRIVWADGSGEQPVPDPEWLDAWRRQFDPDAKSVTYCHPTADPSPHG